MENLIVFIGLLILVSVGFVYFRLKEMKKPDNEKILYEYIESLRKDLRDTSSLQRKETQDRLDRINDKLAQGLKHTSISLQEQFKTLQKQSAHNSGVIKEVTEQLTKLGETNKQVLSFSQKMESLENILKNPKKRGILGEYFLETLLGNVLPPNQYKMQYKFDNNELVDAVIFFNDKIIPIDAKFSLEKYNLIMEENDEKRREKLEKEFKTDIKNRIDETSKYIKPNENTTDFAFMFIPAEGVYYNLLTYKINEQLNINANDLIEYAFKKHVIIVSPTTFFAYLETVLQGLKALKMEESVKEIIKKVEQLGKHIGIYEDYMQKLGNHLGTTVNTYNKAYKEFNKIDKDVYKITDGVEGGNVDMLLIDKPVNEV